MGKAKETKCTVPAKRKIMREQLAGQNLETKEPAGESVKYGSEIRELIESLSNRAMRVPLPLPTTRITYFPQ